VEASGSAAGLAAGLAAEAVAGVEQRLRALHTSHGDANPGSLFAALSEVLSAALGPEGTVDAAPGLLEALAHRAGTAMWVKDRNPVANAALLAALDFPASLAWARSVAASAAARPSAAAGAVLDATWAAEGPVVAEAAP
jgi:succinate dehydrogenase/fumarate reductase flavoprotein subunit